MSPPKTRNRLLSCLSSDDFELLRPSLNAIELPLRFSLEKPARPIEYVYFPESGIASVVAMQSRQTHVEVGLIGSEGMSGLAVLLGNHQTPNTTYMQVAGQGLRLSAEELRKVAAQNVRIRKTLLKFVQAFLVQVSHTAIANAHCTLDQRLARWILMAHDRAASATIRLTHEFLSLMLAVRRAGVTEALQELVRRGLIKSSRGEITILDREGLELSAGRSYGVPESEYRRLFS
jgi:CRP-like cAMP-binding protein